MLSNSWKITWRNFKKDKQFAFLNLVGLSTGLACVLMIYLWVRDERSIDGFHQHDKRLYQVMQVQMNGSATDQIPAVAAKALMASMPEIEHAAVSTFDPGPSGIISADQKHIKVKELFVTNHFFSVFSYTLIHGDKLNVLTSKNDVLLSEELALRLFNTTENIIGKTIEWKNFIRSGLYKVTGIFRKPPANSSQQFDLLFAYDYFLPNAAPEENEWGGSAASTYLVLRKDADVKQFTDKINKYIQSIQNEWPNRMFLQKYADIYLYNRYENGMATGGRIEYVQLFSIIAIIILIIACVNFMNLATARATRRLKEVGIKKVVGASRRSLIVQYLAEAIGMSFLAFVLALLLVILFLPQFNHITGKNLALPFDGNILLTALMIVLFTGSVAGSYPAFYLSGFNPVTVLKGKIHTSFSEKLIRKGLVVLQFTLSAIFIIAVLIIYKQMQFVQTKELGYQKDNIISFRKEGKLNENLPAFLAEIKKMPGVVNAASFENNMIGDHGATSDIRWEGKSPNDQTSFGIMLADFGIMEMLGLQMNEGRSFSGQFGDEGGKIIFNEAAIKAMGVKDPIGKMISSDMWGQKQIIGVVKDFHFESLYKKVKPLFILYYPETQNILVKISAGKERETISRLEKFYTAFNLGLPFEFHFLDEDYQLLYASEKRVATLSRYFAGMAIIISCLGLFGLAAFTAQRRQKEIGIRKIVGASASRIAIMLSKDFLRLVSIAVLIAFPLSWWLMHRWLQAFTYRIDIGWQVFFIAGLAILMIALMTVCAQAIKAAVVNPVKSLRTE